MVVHERGRCVGCPDLAASPGHLAPGCEVVAITARGVIIILMSLGQRELDKARRARRFSFVLAPAIQEHLEVALPHTD